MLQQTALLGLSTNPQRFYGGVLERIWRKPMILRGISSTTYDLQKGGGTRANPRSENAAYRSEHRRQQQHRQLLRMQQNLSFPDRSGNLETLKTMCRSPGRWTCPAHPRPNNSGGGETRQKNGKRYLSFINKSGFGTNRYEKQVLVWAD